MASHRRPKGVYSRDTWDWYIRDSAVVAFWDRATFVAPINGIYTLWSLTNNDGRGWDLLCMSILGNWDTGTMTILSFAGASALSTVATGQSINPYWGAQPGVLGYQRDNATIGFPDPGNPLIGAPYAVLTNAGFQGGYQPNKPVVIIPAGQTLMLANDIGVGTPVAMSIWYTMMPSGW